MIYYLCHTNTVSLVAFKIKLTNWLVYRVTDVSGALIYSTPKAYVLLSLYHIYRSDARMRQ